MVAHTFGLSLLEFPSDIVEMINQGLEIWPPCSRDDFAEEFDRLQSDCMRSDELSGSDSVSGSLHAPCC
jgi:hypothetical protein